MDAGELRSSTPLHSKAPSVMPTSLLEGDSLVISPSGAITSSVVNEQGVAGAVRGSPPPPVDLSRLVTPARLLDGRDDGNVPVSSSSSSSSSEEEDEIDETPRGSSRKPGEGDRSPSRDGRGEHRPSHRSRDRSRARSRDRSRACSRDRSRARSRDRSSGDGGDCGESGREDTRHFTDEFVRPRPSLGPRKSSVDAWGFPRFDERFAPPSSYYRFLAWEREQEETRDRLRRDRRGSTAPTSSKRREKRPVTPTPDRSPRRSRSRDRDRSHSRERSRSRARTLRDEGEEVNVTRNTVDIPPIEPARPVETKPARPTVSDFGCQCGSSSFLMVSVETSTSGLSSSSTGDDNNQVPRPLDRDAENVRPRPRPEHDSQIDPEDSIDMGSEVHSQVDLEDGVTGNAAEQDQSFEDVIRFMRDAHGLGEPGRKPSKAMPFAWSKALPVEEPPLSLALPLSPLLTALRERTSDRFESWGEDAQSPYVPLPSTRERRSYRTENAGFEAPFVPHSCLTSLTMMKKAEMLKVSVSIPQRLLSSFEISSASICEAMSWMEWWGGAMQGFCEKLPVEDRSIFSRLLLSGGKCVNYVAHHGFTTYANLLLLHRESLLRCIPSTVPSDQVVLLRNARMPFSDYLLPSDGATTAVEKKRSALQDTLFQQALTTRRIPRVSSGSRVSKGTVAGTSGVPPGAGASPVVPPGKQKPSSNPSFRGRKRNRAKKSKENPFSADTKQPARQGGRGKGRGGN